MATTDDPAWQEVFGGLERLRAGWPMPEWTYDRRLKCVVSSFPKALESATQAVVIDLLPTTWTAETLPSAPEVVRSLAEKCGGLRAAQLLYWGGGAPDVPGAFGLWWPWGDGNTVSIRLGLHDVDDAKLRYPRLREVFGIPQAAGPATY